MINGNPHDFIDRIYTGQDITFVFDHKKYWFQGYTDKGVAHMEIFQYYPVTDEEYLWSFDSESMEVCLQSFEMAKIFNGKSFWEVENEIEWIDE